MRIVKEANERKNEILDAAGALFASKGYDETSTGDILERVGIARGTLYYHFRSKEEILDALIERMNRALIERAKRAAEDRRVPVVERIVRTIASLRPESDLGQAVMEQVHKPQNALMHQKTQQSMLDGVVPILAGLAEEGNAQGIFHVEFPRETTEMLVLYSGIVFDDRFEQTPEEMTARTQAFLRNTEILLGAEPGSMAGAMARLFRH